MSIKQTKTWVAYRKLLRNYRKAAEELSWAGSQPPEDLHLYQKDYKEALMQLDAFVMSHIAIRAVIKNLTVE